MSTTSITYIFIFVLYLLTIVHRILIYLFFFKGKQNNCYYSEYMSKNKINTITMNKYEGTLKY